MVQVVMLMCKIVDGGILIVQEQVVWDVGEVIWDVIIVVCQVLNVFNVMMIIFVDFVDDMYWL